MFEHSVLQYIIPPVTGIIIGYSTNALAIKMLFWPYKPIFVPLGSKKLRIPFTPGLFPKEQAILAQKVAEIITEKLLTPEDIKQITVALITLENIEKSVENILQAVITEFQDIVKLKKLSNELSTLLESFIQKHLPEIIHTTLRTNEAVKAFLEKAFDDFIFSIHIPEQDAEKLTDVIFEKLCTTENIRQWLIKILTDTNIAEINRLIQSKSKGKYFILTRLITPKQLLESTRNFLTFKPLEANEFIEEIITKVHAKENIQKRISKFRFTVLPYSTVNNIKAYTLNFLVHYITENSIHLAENLSSRDITNKLVRSFLSSDQEFLNSNQLQIIKHETAIFTLKYLEKELGYLLEKAIPALGINNVIAKKINHFSPKELEHIIYNIAKKELSGIELIGGIIGFFIGVLQILMIHFTF